MIAAVLFDRDGTLIADGSACSVAPMPHAAQALQRLRRCGMKLGVVTNQPAIAHGIVDEAGLQATHAQIERLLGAMDGWFVCPHAEAAGCSCRKPKPGLILQAQRVLGVDPAQCVVVGDIGSDVEAAQRAGSRAILVPTPVTRADEIARAPVVCTDLAQAAERVLEWSGVAA